jgi:hypothetical protein
MSSPTDGRFKILIVFLIAVTVGPLAGAQPAPAQDQYFEFQILLARGGSVTRDSILKVYWSELGVRAESTTSAWLALTGKKEVLSLDPGTKLAIKRPWDIAASLRAQPGPVVTFKVEGPGRDQTLGDWKCTSYQLRSEYGPKSKRLALRGSEIQIWLAKNSEVEGRRLVELLANVNLGLARVEQIYKVLPEDGLLVRYQENSTMPAHTTTINLVAQRRVPHDPTRFTVPKDYRIVDPKDEKKPPGRREAGPMRPPHAG